MNDFIPEPYVGHRQAWRMAYLSLFGPIEDDTGIIEKFASDWVSRRELYAPPRTPKTQPETRIGNMIIGTPADKWIPPTAMPKTVALRRLLKDAPVPPTFDPADFLLDAKYVRYLPAGQWIATRDAILQTLVDGNITGYALSGHAQPMAAGTRWATPPWTAILQSGKIDLSGRECPIWFHSDQLAKAFPSRSNRKNPIISDLPQKVGAKSKAEPIANTMRRLWPDGYPGGQTYDQTLVLIANDAGRPNYTISRSTWLKARKIAYPAD